MTEENATLYRGLREVYIDRTTSSYIDGKAGKLYYRGFSIDDLAENCGFEETMYLVMMGELPTTGELSKFVSDLKTSMELPDHKRCSSDGCIEDGYFCFGHLRSRSE